MTTQTIPAVRIRRLRPHELPAVMSVDAATWPRPLPASEWREALEDGWTVAVAVEGPQVVAYAAWKTYGEFIWLAKMAVLPHCQCRGIGRALLARLRRTLVRSGRSHVRLTCRKSNLRAVSFYRRNGYGILSTAPDHYGPGEDALVLVLEVNDGT
jgi:ribosomal-protein-alanine N-acetyltransferase